MSDLENYSIEELEIMLAIAKKKRGVKTENQLTAPLPLPEPTVPKVKNVTFLAEAFPRPLGFIDGIFTDTMFYSLFGESHKFNFFLLPGTDLILANGYEWEFTMPVSWRDWHNGVQCWISHNFIDGTYSLNQSVKRTTPVAPKGKHI